MLALCRSPGLTPSLSYHTFFGGHKDLSLPAPVNVVEGPQAKEIRKLVEVTRGYIEKLNDGNPLRLGPWQILWWQPRYFHAELDGFCHQPISTTERPTGKSSKIRYSAIERIDICETASGLKQEFVVVCSGNRSFTFKAGDEKTCAKIVANLRELVALTAEC